MLCGNFKLRFPIHCAILGKSERLLRWLVDVQCCPVHLVSTANKGKKSYEEDALPTLLTSKGRSVTDIAMETKHIGILRYLVKERGVSVHEVKDLGLVLGALEAIIMEFPEEIEDVSMEKEIRPGKSERSRMFQRTKTDGKMSESAVNRPNANKKAGVDSRQQHKSYTSQNSMTAHSLYHKVLIPRDIHAAKEVDLYEAVGRPVFKSAENEGHDVVESDDDCSVSTTMNEMVRVPSLLMFANRSFFYVCFHCIATIQCIICKEMPIDRVAIPCGHQVCCMICCNQLRACPSCKADCDFIEIYKP